MVKTMDIEAREAQQGKRMIEVKVRFWTNDLAHQPGQVLPKHGWTSGVVRMKSNRSHGIVPQRPKHFDSLLDISAVIEKVLIEHEIVLHMNQRMKNYVE